MKRFHNIYSFKKSVKITSIFVFLFFLTPFGHAFDLDETVDDNIRKNYNSDKIINDYRLETTKQKSNSLKEVDNTLPELPEIAKTKNKQQQHHTKTPQISPYTKGNTKIHAGTVFEVSNIAQISDWQKKNTYVQFKTRKIKHGWHYTIPQGTIFKAEIVDSHQPQISCNGGLVVIRIYSIIYKGQTIPVNGYVTVADDKKIFLNNIKGKRTYLTTLYKKGKWGRSLFGRMFNLTVSLGKDGSTFLLSPFPLLYGTVCLGANTIISPVTAFFSKGGHVSIPAGSNFKIRISEDLYIN